jgi:indolepyruvate ferredoxin oxidoreductase
VNTAASLAEAALDDKYRLERGRIFVTGVQALVRLPMLQHERDRAAGLNTAGFVSGYRGSPIGGLDNALHDARAHLSAHDVRFRPGVNEDLAATAVWGTQQLHLLPGAARDGIFSMWYGKGPGVDRSGDVFRHANYAGTSAHGGVLVVAADDHAARSSAVAHQSEHIFSACAMPVLAPAGVQDILDFGLHGWAMSRYTGCWVALKLSADVVEGSATVEVDTARVQVRLPEDFALPADGVHIRWPDPQSAQELRMQAYKIYAAAAYARANGLDRLVWDSPRARLGVVACGKAWLDLRQALHELGIDAAAAQALGLRVYKVGMPWPLEAAGARRFAAGLEEILVVEEKRQIIEYQLKEMLYNWRDDVRPRVLGKFDEVGEWPAPHGQWLLPPTGELTPALVARAVASRLARLDPAGPWSARAAALDAGRAMPRLAPLQRMPYFCPGCPHNRSTVVPEGSCALGGVGCHLMAVAMERSTLTICQMGGEGATWIGMAEHAGTQHVFANMGDGTYFHSGLLAIRAAVAARVNITYKLLYNDAVAMTGGQPVDGPLTVPQLTRQLEAEGVARIVVLADDPGKYPRDAAFAPGVQVLPRERLDEVQRELRSVPGATVLVYDQTCATEARRRRKRGALPALQRHVFINEAVCEGCGDCSVKSNCLSVVPVETEFGTKRAIDPYTCNADLSCLEGECPALVSVEGAVPRRAAGVQLDPEELPEAVLPALNAAEPYSLLVAGTGGTGVVTLGALIGMAAHLEGKAVTVLDQTGLAQKGGAVLTHVRIAADAGALFAPRIVHADLLLGCDLLVAAAPATLERLRRGRTQAVINTAAAITGEQVRHPETGFPRDATLALLRETLGAADELDATRLASRLVGDAIATNMFMLGYAWQRGLVPVGRAALQRAVELNGVAVGDNRRAFDWGRSAAVDRARAEQRASAAEPLPPSRRPSRDLDESIARRRADLVAYQGASLAARYAALVERVRRAEQQAAPGSERLALAVARQAHRLFAYKDEYEVARLYRTAAFDDALAAAFEGTPRLHLHLALPWRRPAASGALRKQEFGPWMLHAMRLIALGKVLRGTPFDPLGWTAERRMERALAADYVATVERLVLRLDAAHLDAAVAIAELPDGIRGYGSVKQRNARAVRERERELLARYEADAPDTQPLAHAA